MMVFAAASLLAVQYFADDISKDVFDYQWVVDAADD